MSFSAMSSGTDEFRVGGDPLTVCGIVMVTHLAHSSYQIMEILVAANNQWDNLYIGIGQANTIIENSKANASC